jgi:hypothetical protein
MFPQRSMKKEAGNDSKRRHSHFSNLTEESP